MNESEEKIREEAKVLINQTKKMMKNLPNRNNSKSKKNKSSNGFGSYLSNSTGHRKISNLSYPKMDSPRREISNESNIVSNNSDLLNLDLIDSKVDLKATIRRLTDKVYELTILNEELQKENKKQKEIIESLRRKLKTNEEVIKSLNTEKTTIFGDDPIVENSKLKRKIAALENQLTENSFVYEQVIDEYKTKLKELLNQNTAMDKELKTISYNNENLALASQNLQRDLEEKTNQVNNYTIQYADKENNERIYLKKIDKLENQIRVLIAKIKALGPREAQNNKNINQLIGRFNCIFPYQQG